MKIYMFGGSFDPPHLGHIQMVNHLISDCDKLYIFPVKKSPKKVNGTIATSDQRFKMCHLSFQSISPKIEVSNFELNAPSPSYTINTVRWVLSLFPGCDLSIIIGEDQGGQLDTWHDFSSLQKLVKFICFSRKFFELNSEIEFEYIHNFNYEISSTELRSKLFNGLDRENSMLHPQVFDYILENKLYSC